MRIKPVYLLVLLNSIVACSNDVKKEAKPNVIFILVDDMGFSDIGAYGSEINTPNIDKLAFNGIRFSNAYNTSKCFPSRACLLTGLYSQQIGYNRTFKLPMSNAITLGELFKMAGYTTMWSGKHHSIENPVNRGFDHYSGLLGGASNHFNPGLQRKGEGIPAQKRNSKKDVNAPYRNWAIDGQIISPYTPPKDFYTTDAFTDYALNWIDDKADSPFFLYMSYTAPHDPLMAWPKDIKKYKNKYNVGYEAIRENRFLKQKKMGVISESTLLSEPEYQNWDNLSVKERLIEAQKMEVYAAMIDRVDQNIGRLLSKLESMGELNNTLILFASDNGGSSANAERGIDQSGPIGSLTHWRSLQKNWANVSNTPYRQYKNWSHEGGIKTPLIAYWPKGINSKNKIVATPVHFIDIMSTFSDLLNIEYPTEYNGENIIPTSGKSFLSYFNSDDDVKRNSPLFWEWNNGKAVRQGDWKLVAYKNIWALYNLKNDPIEELNLIETNPKIADSLKLLYNDWLKKVASPKFSKTKRTY
jgi:arylsulfatase